MLSKKAKYAIKALEFIAKQNPILPIHTAAIAETQRIPRKFLEAILVEMKKDGILRSKQGKSGGYFLNQAANEIKLGHIIRLIDGPIALVQCVSYKYYKACDECLDESTCGLKVIMADVREATNKVLNKVSLADLLQNEKLLRKKSTKKLV
jgi:Rrf2 family protein